MLDVPKPSPGPGEVLVKVLATSLCGTDNHIYRWDEWAQGRIHPPRIIGHELCGEVVEAGPGVAAVAVGDYVAAESHITCAVCFQCRTGNAHVCKNYRILGIDEDGSYAENGGRVTLFGIPEARVSFDMTNEIIFKGIRVYGVTGRRLFQTWYRLSGLFKAGLNIKPVVTHVLPLDKFAEGFVLVAKGQCGKVVLRP